MSEAINNNIPKSQSWWGKNVKSKRKQFLKFLFGDTITFYSFWTLSYQATGLGCICSHFCRASQETCQGKVTQLYPGFCYLQLVKNGVDSSSSIRRDGDDPEALARAPQISHLRSSWWMRAAKTSNHEKRHILDGETIVLSIKLLDHGTRGLSSTFFVCSTLMFSLWGGLPLVRMNLVIFDR